LLAGTALVANAQTVNQAPVSVKDVDMEVRNAYQDNCSIGTSSSEAICSFSPLPAGKRLAIRWFSAFCRENGSRVLGIALSHPLSDSGDQIFGVTTRFRSLQSFGFGLGGRILEEPVYAHSDRNPSVHVILNGSNVNTTTFCDFAVRGYLVNKQ
ncbi:MAG: hypothetical protein H7039_09260, partial [Bryobacteraceae bacterium]|nr:hypothetical protein [Bryobacteraceae bacterium]